MAGAFRSATLGVIVPLVGALAGPSVGWAAPMHMDIKVTARPAKGGRVCGATITCKVRSDDAAGGFTQVRVGLAPVDIVRQIDSGNPGRMKAWDQSHGVIKAQSGTLTGLVQNAVHDVSIDVDYDGATFAPGKKFQVVSGWNQTSNPAYVHVFGAATSFGTENEITLP